MLATVGDPELPGDLDGVRFPKLAGYLRRLPDGLASYPECRSKGSLIRTAVEGHDVSGLTDGLPDELLEAIHNPPPNGLWTKATHSDAVFYVFVDTLYPTRDAMLQWTRERILRGSESRLYRAIFTVTSPWAMLRIAAAAHGLVQRGTDLEVEKTDTGTLITLTHPPHLHGGFNHLANVATWQAVLELTGGKSVRVRMISSEPTRACYNATWT